MNYNQNKETVLKGKGECPNECPNECPIFESSDVKGVLNITMANRIYIDIENIKPRMQNQIRRLAAFNNPEFYKNQAMGFSTQEQQELYPAVRI